MASEKQVIALINQKYFPFKLAGFLFLIAAVGMCFMQLISSNEELIWMVGGTELLLYLLANGICSLSVKEFSPFLKKTIVAYIFNLLFLLGIIFLLLGNTMFNFDTISPIYGALIFCFFTSIGLIMVIRQVLEMLND